MKPGITSRRIFDEEHRHAIESRCKQALILMRSGGPLNASELAVLAEPIWVLGLSLAERLLLGRTNNRELDAEDVADAFFDVALRNGFRNFDINRRFLPYAIKTVARLVIVKVRCNGRRRFLPLPEGIPDRMESRTSRIERQEIRALVRRAMRRLPKDLRRALIARFWLGLSPRAAADRLGIKVRAFNGRTFRARMTLRELLEGEDFRFSR